MPMTLLLLGPTSSSRERARGSLSRSLPLCPAPPQRASDGKKRKNRRGNECLLVVDVVRRRPRVVIGFFRFFYLFGARREPNFSLNSTPPSPRETPSQLVLRTPQDGFRSGQPLPGRRDAGTAERSSATGGCCCRLSGIKTSPSCFGRPLSQSLFWALAERKELEATTIIILSATGTSAAFLRSSLLLRPCAGSCRPIGSQGGPRNGRQRPVARLNWSNELFFRGKLTLVLIVGQCRYLLPSARSLVSIRRPLPESCPLSAHLLPAYEPNPRNANENHSNFSKKIKKMQRRSVAARAEGSAAPPPPPAPVRKDRSKDQLIFASEQSLG